MVILAVIGAILSFLRIPADARDVLYAEDGEVFLSRWVNVGHYPVDWLGILVEPYEGYQHVVPVVATRIISLLPPDQWAIACALAASVVIGCVGAATYVASADLLQRRSLRLLAAAVPVLLPIGGVEAVGNLANIHWYLPYVLFWVFLRKAQLPDRSALPWAAVAAVASMTEVQVAFLAPLVAWRALRSPASRPVAAGWAVGLVPQVVSYLAQGRRRMGEAPTWAELWDGFLGNGVIGSFEAHRSALQAIAGRDYTAPSQPLAWATVGLAVLVILAVVVGIRSPSLRLPLTVALLASCGSWVAAAGYNNVYYPGLYLFRWGTASSLFFWATIVLLIASVRETTIGRVGRALLIVASLAVFAYNFEATLPDRRTSPDSDRQLPSSWTIELARTSDYCRAGQAPSVWVSRRRSKTGRLRRLKGEHSSTIGV